MKRTVHSGHVLLGRVALVIGQVVRRVVAWPLVDEARIVAKRPLAHRYAGAHPRVVGTERRSLGHDGVKTQAVLRVAGQVGTVDRNRVGLAVGEDEDLHEPVSSSVVVHIDPKVVDDLEVRLLVEAQVIKVKAEFLELGVPIVAVRVVVGLVGACRHLKRLKGGDCGWITDAVRPATDGSLEPTGGMLDPSVAGIMGLHIESRTSDRMKLSRQQPEESDGNEI